MEATPSHSPAVAFGAKLSAKENVEHSLRAIESRDGKIQAFLGVDAPGAQQQAEEHSHRNPAAGLAGIPIAIKDNICVNGWKTTCGSRMLEDFEPPYDAHVIQRLRGAGAIPIGRTNLDEFAMGSSCENSAFQKTRNPWNIDCSPGGSSGGSAAAVAAGMVPVALGSDTGGSIRQPAAFCGVVGIKPTYGRVSRYGLVAFASSLDQIGVFSRNTADAAAVLEVICGHDPRDATSVNLPAPQLLADLNVPLQNLRIGVVPSHLSSSVDPEVTQAVRDAMEVYRRLGASIVEIDLPNERFGVAAYYVIAPSEASSNLARYDGVHYGHRAEKHGNLVDMYETSRGEGFGSEVKRRIMLGTYALSSGYYDAYYVKALKVRRLIANDYAAAFNKVDVILTPTAPTPAFRIGELADDPLQMYLNDVYTIGANLAGLPGISLPCGMSSQGLPIGLQLLAPAFEEGRLLRAARMFETQGTWMDQIAP